MNKLLFVPVALTLAGSGCSLLVDPAKSDPLETAEGFCDSVQDSYMRLVKKCAPQEAAQIESMMRQWRLGCESLGNAASAGRVGYSRGIAESCMDRLDAVVCTDPDIFTVFEYCATATPGRVAVGGACSTTPWGLQSECVAGSACASNALTCPGTCTEPGRAYQPCVSAPGISRCADGYYCEGMPPTPYVVPTCFPVPATVGARCDTTSYDCGNGLACGYDAAYGYYTCKAPAGHGADCSVTDYECALAADYCRYNYTTSTYACTTRPTSPQPVGGDCYDGGDSSCQAGLVCDWAANYTCATPFPVGAYCDDTNDQLCPSTATCSMAPLASSGSCVTRRKLGQSCTVGNEECDGGLWCGGAPTGAQGICMGRSGAGGPCGKQTAVWDSGALFYVYREEAYCLPTVYCDRISWDSPGTCQPFGGVGTNCASPNYDACGEPWTGLQCDGTSQTCVANACSVAFGFIPFN